MNEPLRKARDKAGLTLQEVANVVGISLRQYQRIETGDIPRADVAIKIAKLLNTTVEKVWR